MEDRYEFAEDEHRRKLKITRLVEDDEGPFQSTIKSEFEFTPDKTRLTFKNVNHDDVASVQCNVTNERGYAFGDAYLAVIEPLVITEQPNATIDTELGDKSVNLTISATADTCCPLKFSWYLDGRDLKATALEKPPYSYQRDDNTVYGRYRCYVWHDIYHNNNNNYNRNVTVHLRMNHATTGILVFLMIHYNYPRQEYLLEKEERKHQLNPERDLLDQSFTEI
nr:hypothetical protein BaRGS_008389 [Batillaria attramentaria]